MKIFMQQIYVLKSSMSFMVHFLTNYQLAIGTLVISVGRLPSWPTPSFGSLNLDGPPSSPSPPSFPPPLSDIFLGGSHDITRYFRFWYDYARSICKTMPEVTRVSPTWPNNSTWTTIGRGGCRCRDRLTAIYLRHVHLPPHFHLRARIPTNPTAPTSGQRGAGRRTRMWGSMSTVTSKRRLLVVSCI